MCLSLPSVCHCTHCSTSASSVGWYKCIEQHKTFRSFARLSPIYAPTYAQVGQWDQIQPWHYSQRLGATLEQQWISPGSQSVSIKVFIVSKEIHVDSRIFIEVDLANMERTMHCLLLGPDLQQRIPERSINPVECTGSQMVLRGAMQHCESILIMLLYQ
jgi:hypothetical protein